MGTTQGRSWYSAGWFRATVGVTGILGTVVTVLAYLFPLESGGTPVPGPSAHLSATGLANPPSLPAQPAPTPTLTSPAQVAPTLFDGEVRLELKTGVNIEGGQQGGQINGVYSEGISGSMDLYLNWLMILQVASDGPYTYRGLERDAQKHCTDIINSGRPPQSDFPITGSQFCFMTSDNHVAWTRVSTSNLNTYTGEQYVILRVKVWE
jgi:hypothetical protein